MLRLFFRTIVVVALTLIGLRLGETMGLVVGIAIATILIAQTEEVLLAVRASIKARKTSIAGQIRRIACGIFPDPC